jgi:hypothetical protein
VADVSEATIYISELNCRVTVRLRRPADGARPSEVGRDRGAALPPIDVGALAERVYRLMRDDLQRSRERE